MSGCAGLFNRDEDRPVIEDEDVHVRVINDNFYDVTVYVDRQGARVRLGRVTGQTEQTFTFRARVGDYVAFAVAVQAGRTHVTQQLTVEPGDIIELQVPPDLHRR